MMLVQRLDYFRPLFVRYSSVDKTKKRRNFLSFRLLRRLERRERDSNPRYLSVRRFSRPL